MKKIINVVLLLSLVIAASACSSKYKEDIYDGPEVGGLAHEPSFYVVLPEDGRYQKEKIYAGSGVQAQQAVVAALSLHTNKIVAAKNVEDKNQALQSAQSARVNYVFGMTIVDWEDHATTWSGKPDQVVLRFIIYDAATGKEVASTVARGSSKLITFSTSRPQDLLKVPTEAFVAKLFK